MTKTLKKTIAFILMVCTLTLAMTSCWFGDGRELNYPPSIFPKGYTCGFPYQISQPGAQLEFWWVETYEECLDAMELLTSHGSTFDQSVIFSYEGDLFDTKYYFKISTSNTVTETIQFGDNPFDRRALDVEVKSYAFFDDVTIEEINYGDIRNYNTHTFGMIYFDSPPEKSGLTYDNVIIKDGIVYSLDEKQVFFSITSFGAKDDPQKAEECIRAVLDSIEFIGYD